MNQTPITTLFDSINALRAQGRGALASHLRERGFCGLLQLLAGAQAAEAYVTPRGRVEYVSGSPDLVRRYVRERQLARRREARRAREDVLKSLSLRKVRGNLGGTYWE
jgi:hypothetical protein